MNIKKIAVAAATALVVVSVNAETLRVGSETVYPPFEFLVQRPASTSALTLISSTPLAKRPGLTCRSIRWA